MLGRRSLPAYAAALLLPLARLPAADLAHATAEQIRIEATRPNGDPLGHALPLAGHWNTGTHPPEDTFDPQYQLQLIEQGHHVIPCLNMPAPGPLPKKTDYWERALRRMAGLHLPFALIASQWESKLTYDKAYLELPADQNPNVVALDGRILKQVDPLGPVGPWREVGRAWGASEGMAKLAEWYPDPPKVLLISNNEHAKLVWSDVEQAKRYVDQYGLGRDDDFKRKVVADGWIERYRALIAAFRDGLASPQWKQNAIFIGYDAFGPPHFARMGGWREYSLYVPGRIDFNPLVWDGGSPSFYTHNWNASTDYTVWSPQVEAMNWVFMQEEALKLNPHFWFELGTWDGSVDQRNDKRRFYLGKGQTYDADRYGGMVQFGMWLNRPRSVREFRGWTERRSVQGQYFLAVVAAVDRVYAEPVLTRFWRQGQLVPNTAHEHPYQAKVPEEYKAKQRWFGLDTSVDPLRPWSVGTELPVFALALSLGEGGEREWLVYAHSPLATREGVKVSIPGYQAVTMSIPPQGVFCHVIESTHEANAIAVPKLPPAVTPEKVRLEV
jgi:hypothetical protein